MGFTPQRSTLKIVFDEDTPLHGLVIRARSCTIGEWNEMLKRAEDETNLRGMAAVAANDEFAQFFLGYVDSWNLELEEGVPSPITLDTWHKMDRGWDNIMITAWQFAMTVVPTKQPRQSMNGNASAEESLGLGDISESLPNWQPPS